MKPSLHNIIADENRRREEQLADKARSLIREIGKEQEAIQQHHQRISEIRAELKALEIKDLDASTILGTPAAAPGASCPSDL